MTATTAKLETKATPLPLRNDTLLGVCEALGQDFGISATWFRLAFIAPLFFFPLYSIAAYFAIGALVALTRWIAPNPAASTMTVDAPARVIEEEEVRLAA